jgi:parvulin-like peptidyl-prolyl isomerase
MELSHSIEHSYKILFVYLAPFSSYLASWLIFVSTRPSVPGPMTVITLEAIATSSSKNAGILNQHNAHLTVEQLDSIPMGSF